MEGRRVKGARKEEVLEGAREGEREREREREDVEMARQK